MLKIRLMGTKNDIKWFRRILVYSFDIALQNEFSIEENIALTRQFMSEQLVCHGMIVDFATRQRERRYSKSLFKSSVLLKKVANEL